MQFATLAVHAGYQPLDDRHHAVMSPIYQSSIFVHETLDSQQPFSYSRSANPTRSALENTVAALEGGRFGFAFASGMAAIDTVLRATLQPGDEVIAVADLYGGAYRLLTRLYAESGIKVTFADLRQPETLRSLLNPAVKLVWLESPSNPLLNLVDIAALADIAHQAGVKVAIDNTFATPYLQQPLALGVDIVMHSATKYLGGHSDVILGVVVVNDEALAARIKLVQNSAGAVAGPQDSFLVSRGIKTLHLRMDRHCQTALQLAQWLETHPAVAHVFYPGLASHPQHVLATRQMKAFGGIVSIYLKEDSRAAAERVAQRLQLFALGESLGGVESIVNHSATMSHGSMPAAVKTACGIREGLLRLSFGVEDAADLQADLAQALA